MPSSLLEPAITAPQASPMQAQDPEQAMLAQLADIQLPADIPSWPPGIQFWIVLAIFLCVLAGLGYWLYAITQKPPYQKHAISAWQRLADQAGQLSTNQLFNEMNTLLKRVCFSAYPEHKHLTAPLYGAAWYNFLLNTHASKEKFVPPNDTEQWFEASYQNMLDDNDDAKQRFIHFSRDWILNHKKLSNEAHLQRALGGDIP